MSIKDEFLKKLKEIARSRNQQIDRAFIHWYINVAFGDVKHVVTDGPCDGGIDAIVRPERRGNKLLYVLQSKYTDSFFKGRTTPPLNPSHYTDFDNLPMLLRSDKKFENWIASVEHGLKHEYQRLRKDFLDEGGTIEWRLITLHSRSRRGENKLTNLGTDAFQYGAAIIELYEMEREGATPPGDPLELTFSESMTIEDKDMGYKSYALAASLRDFINYMDNDPEGRLFARNVRLDLRSEINKDIKHTYLSAPREFWYSHNGITVICSNATISGKTVRLINPSVINGSQTLNTLRGTTKRFPEARVLTRVLVVPSERQERSDPDGRKEFINDVIFRTNQQNKMYAYDLRANDIRQVELARDFMNNGVFYERRRGEWYQRRRAFQNQGIERLNCVELAQTLAAFDPDIGVATAKKGKEELFREKYDKIFYNPFLEIYLTFRVFKFASKHVKEMPSRRIKPRMRKHAILTVASILYGTIDSGKYYNKMKCSTGVINNIWGMRNQPQHSHKLKKITQRIFKDCWSIWRKENKKDPTLSPNNFFKSEQWNSIVRKKLVRKYSRAANAAVGHALEQIWK
ncbi:MAG TPA: AIPR family protein [Candidatus Avalokitesvara rifleensis]|uniref:AIPR family protein n=1 Tax=Candidatus Avalokitesvara rifleensis TaxID=3367620 RepID=UPI00271229DC|nr:AIPR family protein [Candidatus Brocadiales bacterium]